MPTSRRIRNKKRAQCKGYGCFSGKPDSAFFVLFVVYGSAQYAWMVCMSAVQLNLRLNLRSLWQKNFTLSRSVDTAGKLSTIPS